MQLEKVKRAGRDLVSTDEAPSLKAVDILCAAGNSLNLLALVLTTDYRVFSQFVNLKCHSDIQIALFAFSRCKWMHAKTT